MGARWNSADIGKGKSADKRNTEPAGGTSLPHMTKDTSNKPASNQQPKKRIFFPWRLWTGESDMFGFYFRVTGITEEQQQHLLSYTQQYLSQS